MIDLKLQNAMTDSFRAFGQLPEVSPDETSTESLKRIKKIFAIINTQLLKWDIPMVMTFNVNGINLHDASPDCTTYNTNTEVWKAIIDMIVEIVESPNDSIIDIANECLLQWNTGLVMGDNYVITEKNND